MGMKPDLLAQAATDYRWLLDRGYPDQPSLKLVGDRYELSRTERAMLFRGVFSKADSKRRPIEGSGASSTHLLIDGHNVLFTVSNYLAGRPMVLATDGFVRDIGGTQARLPHDERFLRLATLLCTFVRHEAFASVTVLLDAPLPWSREHAQLLDAVWKKLDRARGTDDTKRPAFAVELEDHVDARVAAYAHGVIATSDTGILRRCRSPAVDLAGTIVRTEFDAKPFDMSVAE